MLGGTRWLSSIKVIRVGASSRSDISAARERDLLSLIASTVLTCAASVAAAADALNQIVSSKGCPKRFCACAAEVVRSSRGIAVDRVSGQPLLPQRDRLAECPPAHQDRRGDLQSGRKVQFKRTEATDHRWCGLLGPRLCDINASLISLRLLPAVGEASAPDLGTSR